MSGKSSSKRKNHSKNSKSGFIVLIAALVIAAAVICITAVISKAGKSSGIEKTAEATTAQTTETKNDTADEDTKGDTDNDTEADTDDDSGAQIIAEGESLIIKTADITTEASFYTIEVDGTEMEVLVIRDDDGNVKTAFNTCEVCYSSGSGYYVQEGDYLVCQNCGNTFTADDVGEEAWGCIPWPITDDDKTVTDDTIEISYEFLKESTDIFASWKTGY